MPTAPSRYPHIALNGDGVAVMKGTRIKLPLFIASHLGNKWDARQLRVQYPQLTLGQIHGALGYYYDHRDEIDREIRRRDDRSQGPLRSLSNSRLQSRLRTAKRKVRS